jgi:hypothetical protein
MNDFAQKDLNTLLRYIEFYKIEHGVYPDSLEQVTGKKGYDLVSIIDPIQSFNNKQKLDFIYKRVGIHYYLFSSGQDGIPYTKDDIYPVVATGDSTRIGLIVQGK